MPRLIWVFAGRTVILLVLSWGGSYLLAKPTEWPKLVSPWKIKCFQYYFEQPRNPLLTKEETLAYATRSSTVIKVDYMSRLISKPTKWHVRPAKTQISLGILPVWSESWLSAWRKLWSSATHWVHSKDSDQRHICDFPQNLSLFPAYCSNGSFWL